jgi:hypothetical protein
MKIEFTASLLLGCSLLLCSPPTRADPGLLHTGMSREDLAAKYILKFGRAEVNELDYHGSSLITVVVDVGSGISRKALYLYARESGQLHWNLIAHRASNSSSIRVDTSPDGVTALSKQGRKLLYIPRDALSLKYDQAEQ